jgi:hypothetical protein
VPRYSTVVHLQTVTATNTESIEASAGATVNFRGEGSVSAALTETFEILVDVDCSVPAREAADLCATKAPQCRIWRPFLLAGSGANSDCRGEIHFVRPNDTCSSLARGDEFKDRREWIDYGGLIETNPHLENQCNAAGRRSGALRVGQPVCFQPKFSTPCIRGEV